MFRSALSESAPSSFSASNRRKSTLARRMVHDARVGEVRIITAKRRSPRPAALNAHTRARIIAAAQARIDPADTAAALGWPLGKLLRVERQIGLRITITIEG